MPYRKYPDWTPYKTNGLVFWGETDTKSFPNCVVLPNDPLVDGNMEAATTAAWTQIGGDTLSKEAVGAKEGTRWIKVTKTTPATPYAYATQVCLTNGNTYRITGWAKSDGTLLPEVWAGGAIISWIGTASTDWQWFDITVVADGVRFYLGWSSTTNGYVGFDDVKIYPQNVTQWTDLSGNGYHLVQLTAAYQPLFTYDGTRNVLRFDGVADYIKCPIAFPWVQPEYVMLVMKSVLTGGVTAAWTDGFTNNSFACCDGGTNKLYEYCGSWSAAGPTWLDNTFQCYEFVVNGASSAAAINNAAWTTIGNSGASNANGLTIAAGGAAISGFTEGDYCMVLGYNRIPDSDERSRIYRYALSKYKF